MDKDGYVSMKPLVYLETTIVSYLTAWRSSHLVTAANQEATRAWWDEVRPNYNICISQVVFQEASSGDLDAASRRREVLESIQEVEVNDQARELAKRLIKGIPLPPHAEIDALHIAVATVHGADYLLTWNCNHIANASLRHRIESVCRSANYEPPIICTPLELMEG